MNLITGFQFLLAAGDAEGGHHEASPMAQFYGLMVLIAIVALVTFLFLGSAKKGLNTKFFSKTTTKLLEQLYVFIEGLAIGIIGPHGKKYIPMMMTFWLVIFVSNLVALLIHASPTSDIAFNLGMALIAVGYVQYEGMRSNGVVGHFSHFAGPKLPIAMAVFITPMIFLIEIVSETMKNVSLSLRLYGNIFGGGEAVVAMNKLGYNGDTFLLPVGDFLFPIKLLTCVVQALIFCLLFAVYLSLVTHHHEEGHDHESHGEAAPAH
ncbi:hypothetical protein C0431_14985 [bacterium]|nr:hypothetical protein [bacterium]